MASLAELLEKQRKFTEAAVELEQAGLAQNADHIPPAVESGISESRRHTTVP